MSWNSFVIFIQLLFLLKCVLSIPHLPQTENTEVPNDVPQETQHAVCKVFTKEIEATAKATITRQLKGVCSSRYLNLRFEELQKDLQQIKQALGLQDHRNQYKSLDSAHPSDRIVSGVTTSTSTTNFPPIDEYSDYIENEDNIKYIKKEIEQSEVSHLKDEISTFNDTIVESSEGDLYFYYWRIDEIRKVLKRRDIYISSPPFSVLGHTLYLQFYPNYRDEYVGILLKPDSNSFLKKHKILFLGQRNTQNQISSRILYGIKNEEKIFKIEADMLNNDFIFSDNLIVKVKIYLGS